MANRLGSHTSAVDRLAAELFRDAGRLTLAQARLLANQAHAHYQDILARRWRDRATSHDVLLARLAWGRSESRVVDLRQGERRGLEGMMGTSRVKAAS